MGITPSWAPSSSTTRTCGIRIIWLTRRSRAMADPFELVSAFQRPKRGHAAARAQSPRDYSTGPESRAIEPPRRPGVFRRSLMRSREERYRPGSPRDPLCHALTLSRGALPRFRAVSESLRRRRTRWRVAALTLVLSWWPYETNSSPDIGCPGSRSHRRSSIPRIGNATSYVALSRNTRRRDVSEAPMTRSRATPRHSQPRSRASLVARRDFRSSPWMVAWLSGRSDLTSTTRTMPVSR